MNKTLSLIEEENEDEFNTHEEIEEQEELRESKEKSSSSGE